MKNEILVIDDNLDIRSLISNLLKEKDFIVREAANYDQALYEINKKLPDMAIIDIKLDKGDKDGIDILKKIMATNNKLPVIMISGHASLQTAIESIRLGAYEFLEKPFSTDKILNYVNRALENLTLKSSNENLESKLFHSFDIVGKNNQITKIKKLIEKLSSAESRVLITGNTGTGKELIARKIHKSSPRKKCPFVVLNSALLQPKKYEKELFGEEFRDGTVAYGALEKADKGTLLIDEVSEIPLETQASILRVLIDQKFKRINGNKDINVNIRIIASTSKDLKKFVEENKFREDLYHRLNVVPIYVPTLQSRSDDIPLLIDYFKKKICEMNGIQEAKINTGNDMLYSYDWPGNIRELRNLVERISILSLNESEKSVDEYLNSILRQSPSTNNKIGIITETKNFPLKEAREVFEKKYLQNQLKLNQGNISKTADFIGMERSALHRKLKSLGIKGIN